MSHSHPCMGWACPALLQSSFFLRCTASQALGLASLPLTEDGPLPSPSATAMAEALSLNLAASCATLAALLEAGAALEATLEQPLPLCAPAAVFGSPYSAHLAALSAPAKVALLLASDMAALPAPVLDVITACLAQHYASLPCAALEAEVAVPSPRCAALIRAWWKAHFSCPQLQWWTECYGVAPDCLAWATTWLPYSPTAAANLPPVSLGLQADSPPPEFWARGLDLPSQPAPPSYAALLALAFDQQEWMQRHHPGLMASPALGLLRGGDGYGVLYELQAASTDVYLALLYCGRQWFKEVKEYSPEKGRVQAVARAALLHPGDAGVVLAAHGALLAREAGRVDALQVLAALQAHAGDAAVTGSLCGAVQVLAAGASRAALVAAGAGQAVAAALVTFSGDARVAVSGCKALLELARGAPCAALAAPAALAALQAHPANTIVKECACAALLCMAMWEGGACAAAGVAPELERVLSQALAGSRLATLAAAALECTLRTAPPRSCIASGSGYFPGPKESDCTVRVWDVATGLCLRVLEAGARVTHVCSSGAGLLVSSQWAEAALGVWDPATALRVHALQGHTEAVTSLCALPEGRVASGAEDRTVRVWSAGTGECLRVLAGHPSPVLSLCALGAARLVSGSSDRHPLRVWDAGTGVCERALQGHRYPVTSVCCTLLPTGHIVSAAEAEGVRVWQARSGAGQRLITGYACTVKCLCPLEEGLFVTGLRGGAVLVWDAPTGLSLGLLQGHTGAVSGLCALEGRRIVSASEDGTLRVWDYEGRACVRVLEGHASSVNAVCVL